jgi:uncharacterized membrane protein
LFKVHRGDVQRRRSAAAKQRAEARYEGRCIGWLGVRFTARRSVSRDIGRVSIVNLRPRNGSESGPAQRRFVREHVHMSHQVRRRLANLVINGGLKMKYAREFVVNAVVGGLLVLLPIYLAVLVLLKGMQSVVGLLRPIAALLPDWVPGENFWSLVIVLIVCFAIGAAVRTRAGRVVRERIEMSFFGRLPGYALFRSLTQRLAGESDENVWKPVLAEIEDALVPAFIVEELDDGRFTVFVPSVPTPFAGAVYILSRERVHLVDIPFTQAIQSVSRWGSGSKDLVAAIRREDPSSRRSAGPTA